MKSNYLFKFIFTENHQLTDSQAKFDSPPLSSTQARRKQKSAFEILDLSDSDEDSNICSRIKNLRSELREYENEKKLKYDDCDPNEALSTFWTSRASKYPTLFKAYKHLGSVPGSGTPSERLFSAFGLEISARRNRLAAERVEGIMFLRENDELKQT